jgi:hypothetical protein
VRIEEGTMWWVFFCRGSFPAVWFVTHNGVRQPRVWECVQVPPSVTGHGPQQRACSLRPSSLCGRERERHAALGRLAGGAAGGSR